MTAYDEWDSFVQAQKRRISIADTEALARGRRNFSGMAAEARAGAFVWIAAALEKFLRDFLAETIAAISTLAVPAEQLKHSLFALVCDTEFGKVRSGDNRTAWQSRLAIMARLTSSEVASLCGPGPLDGKTVRAYHFEALWITFDLPGTPWLSALHRAILNDLADGRNEVAHGEVEPVRFGRGRTFLDCTRMLEIVDESVLHMVVEMDAYLANASYRR